MCRRPRLGGQQPAKFADFYQDFLIDGDVAAI
jgi:hypothetical protein